jgi:hypothetical protein
VGLILGGAGGLLSVVRMVLHAGKETEGKS